MKSPRRFYVYVLFDWHGVPFYIGKGTGNRWRYHEIKSDPNNWLKNEFVEHTFIRIGEVPKIKIREDLTETEAFATEIALIAAIGRIDQRNGPLVNMTDGGDGTSGHIVTAEVRQRLRELNLGKRPSAITREKLRIARRNRIESAETKEKRKRTLRGQKRTSESCERIRIARNKQVPPSEETKLKISASMKLAYQEGRHTLTIPSTLGIKYSPEAKANMSASHPRSWLGRTHLPKTIAKMSESGKKAWIKRRGRLV